MGLKIRLGLEFILSTWERGEGKLLLVKCSEALSNRIRKSSLFCFEQIFCPLDPRICFCLKRTRYWFEFRIKFSMHEIFPESIGGIYNLYIHFIFREFNWVSIPKIPSPHLQMESWGRCLGGRIFLPLQRKSYILSISLLILSFFHILE